LILSNFFIQISHSLSAMRHFSFLLFAISLIFSSLLIAPFVKAQPTYAVCSNVTWVSQVQSSVTPTETWVSSVYHTTVQQSVVATTSVVTPTVVTPDIIVPIQHIKSYVTVSTTSTSYDLNIVTSTQTLSSTIQTIFMDAGYVSVCAEWVATAPFLKALPDNKIIRSNKKGKVLKNGKVLKSGKAVRNGKALKNGNDVHDFEDENVNFADFQENLIEDDVVIAAVTSFAGAVCAVSAVASTCVVPLTLNPSVVFCLSTVPLSTQAVVYTIQTIS